MKTSKKVFKTLPHVPNKCANDEQGLSGHLERKVISTNEMISGIITRYEGTSLF
jgi:hypothetical protein